MSKLEHKYDFILFFDVMDGNPNGDPDAGNLPRVDPETGHGLVTDVCLKRKLRNYVQLHREGVTGYDIYVKEKAVLSSVRSRAYAQTTEGTAKADRIVAARRFMCQNFFDVRTFGAVMSTKENNAGQVRGPVQLTFSRSIDPIVSLEHSITRMAVETEAEAKKQDGDNRTMGRKATVPYALYRCQGFISANLAQQTGFSAEDLELLWDGLEGMFEEDRSAARGFMNTRKLIIFEHSSPLGNAPAHRLFERVKAQRREAQRPPRGFADYAIEIAREGLPEGIRLLER